MCRGQNWNDDDDDPLFSPSLVSAPSPSFLLKDQDYNHLPDDDIDWVDDDDDHDDDDDDDDDAQVEVEVEPPPVKLPGVDIFLNPANQVDILYILEHIPI